MVCSVKLWNMKFRGMALTQFTKKAQNKNRDTCYKKSCNSKENGIL